MSNSVHKEKIVVFDLDETLGNFIELGMFWEALENYYGHKLPDPYFFETVDLFEEFLRPNIITILKFLLEKKKQGKCNSLMIYTNNQGPKTWARMISRYFDAMENLPLTVLLRRSRCVEKWLRCVEHRMIKAWMTFFGRINYKTTRKFAFWMISIIPLWTQKYFVNVKPYTYSIPFRTMAERYYDNSPRQHELESKDIFVNTIEKFMNRMIMKVNQRSFGTRSR